MVFRTFLAGACAVAIGAATAGPATASPPSAGPVIAEQAPAAGSKWYLYYPAAVQVWGPIGYLGTIRCTSTAVHPACDPAQGPKNTNDLTREYGGYRLLARTGRWFQLGGSEEVVESMFLVDATGGRGAARVIEDEGELDPYEP